MLEELCDVAPSESRVYFGYLGGQENGAVVYREGCRAFAFMQEYGITMFPQKWLLQVESRLDKYGMHVS